MVGVSPERCFLASCVPKGRTSLSFVYCWLLLYTCAMQRACFGLSPPPPRHLSRPYASSSQTALVFVLVVVGALLAPLDARQTTLSAAVPGRRRRRTRARRSPQPPTPRERTESGRREQPRRSPSEARTASSPSWAGLTAAPAVPPPVLRRGHRRRGRRRAIPAMAGRNPTPRYFRRVEAVRTAVLAAEAAVVSRLRRRPQPRQ